MPDPTDPDDVVRRLLAEARHTEPMPADVAARLDEALARARTTTEPGAAPDEVAAASQAQQPAPAPVADLAARRRRRWVSVLGAAAAVVIVGVVGVQGGRSVLEGGQSGDSAADSAAGDSAEDGGALTQDRDTTSDGLGATPDDQPSAGRGDQTPRIRADHVRADIARALAGSARGSGTPQDEGSAYPDGCREALPAGRTLAVRYAGRPALLVATPERASLYRCAGQVPERLRTVPRSVLRTVPR